MPAQGSARQREEEIEWLAAETGRLIREAEPARRAELAEAASAIGAKKRLPDGRRTTARSYKPAGGEPFGTRHWNCDHGRWPRVALFAGWNSDDGLRRHCNVGGAHQRNAKVGGL